MSEQPRRAHGVRACLADLALDAAGIGGTLLVIHGVDLFSRPLAFIVGGLALLVVTSLMARRAA